MGLGGLGRGTSAAQDGGIFEAVEGRHVVVLRRRKGKGERLGVLDGGPQRDDGPGGGGGPHRAREKEKARGAFHIV